MKYLLLLVSLITLNMLNGCTVPTSSTSSVTLPSVKTVETTPKKNPYTETKQQLLQAKTKWQQQANRHYIYTLQRSCFCPPESRKPMRIRVKENSIVQVLLVPENITKPVSYRGALSVDSLFNLIQNAINNNAASIKVRYDTQYGYPTSITIDQDVRIADEEIYYKASGMRLL